MKNNYKQLLAKSPSEPSVFKRSASHSLRSSLRITRKLNNNNAPTTATTLSYSSLPSFIPPKAAALLEIPLPPLQNRQSCNNDQRLKVASIRKRSVWANSAAKITLPSHHDDEVENVETSARSLDDLCSSDSFREFRFEYPATMDEGILKEINKNSTSDPFKAIKKHKFGQSKKPEANVLCAIFETIENNQSERLKEQLKNGGDAFVNTLNSDGFYPLDEAILLEQMSMIKVLMLHGAKTTITSNNIEMRLNTLLNDAEKKLCLTAATISSSAGQQSCMVLDHDKQKNFYDQRIKLLKKMISGWYNLKLPDAPFSFAIDVVGTNSVLVKILQPLENSVCTDIKVEYSSREDFSILIGEKIINEWKDFEGTLGVNFRLDNLIQGRRYFFRACCGNMKGFGLFSYCHPRSVVPSSWHDICSKEKQEESKQRRESLDRISSFIDLLRETHNAEAPRRNLKKKTTTIKQLFTATSKFQKSLKRGIHLACVCYSEDKILVTNEDFIPIIEIADIFPSNLKDDFNWLMKISFAWDSVKDLKDEIERNDLAKLQFRFKILSAIHQMQLAVGATNLGKFFHRLLKDSDGTVVFCTVMSVKEQKSSLNLKWIPLTKLQRRLNNGHAEDKTSMQEMLINSLAHQLQYEQVTRQKLSRGLYLGYLKIYSSLDTIQVVCQAKNPTVLPHCKIRDNPHVSAEEWASLKPKDSSKNNQTYFDLEKHGTNLVESQKIFMDSLKLSLSRLFKFMNISPEEALNHKLFDIEVVELNADVTFLVICSPITENTLLSKDIEPETSDLTVKRSDLICLPLNVHELIQFNVYQHDMIKKYVRLSFFIELETDIANLRHREAFSNNEVVVAKEKLKNLNDAMNDLNNIWKNSRWISRVINFSRNKEPPTSAIDVKTILQFNNKLKSSDHLFKIPYFSMNSSPSRGSWTAPQNAGLKTFMFGEHSKSEIMLNGGGNENVQHDRFMRNNSEINCFTSDEERSKISNARLPSSKSEDTLVVIRKKSTPNSQHRKRPTTVITNSSSDSSEAAHSSGKTSNLVVHRVNNVPFSKVEHIENPPPKDEASGKSKLRVSHHPKAKKDSKKLFESSQDEASLVTFLKPAMNSKNDSNRSFNDPLLIVEDEAVEMLSSPFRVAPAERSKHFSRSDFHSSILQSICKATESDTQSINQRAFDFFNETEIQNEASSVAFAKAKSNHQGEENLNEREYENLSAITENEGNTQTSMLHVITVYAAYQTGLGIGTALKLKCHKKTTAREVIELVVKQLNMAVIMKGKDGPIYDENNLNDFCLVAVIGLRERCLRPDFRPLELQSPWKKGKLFVRKKSELLAAIEHSSRETISI